MSADDLSAALWQERRQLELLLFRLETQRLHMAAGNVQWLSFTSMEIESVLNRLSLETLARAGESAAVAIDWKLPPQAGLVELAAAAPRAPWAGILQEHVVELRKLLRQLRQAVRANGEFLESLRAPEAVGKRLDVSRQTAGDVFGASDAGADVDKLAFAGNIQHALAVLRHAPQSLLAAYVGDDED